MNLYSDAKLILYFYKHFFKAFDNVPGIPTEKELTDTYCYYRGIKPPLSNWNFYIALSIFRMVGIGQVNYVMTSRNKGVI